jgi:hypothetical protein
MPQLTSHLTGAQWTANGPTTPAQRFFHQYVSAVDSKGYNTGSGLRFYSPTVTFHNQNGAVYHGGDEMWAWMKKLFGVFSRIQHDWIHFVEIELDDKGTSQIYLQGMRNLWIVGDDVGGEPSVSIPVTFIAVVGKSDGTRGLEETPEGLCFREVWLYWDTALLLPFLEKDAVVFKTENVVSAGEVDVCLSG